MRYHRCLRVGTQPYRVRVERSPERSIEPGPASSALVGTAVASFKDVPLSLDELGRLVSDVSREHKLGVEVVGVTRSEGEGQYAEVIVTLRDRHARRRRVSLGLQRGAAVVDLKKRILEKLRARIARADDDAG